MTGRRNCKRCTRWKLDIEFPWRWQRRKGKRDRYARPVIEGTCHACRREQARERYQARPLEERRAIGRRANENRRKRIEQAREQAHRARRAYLPGGGLAELPLTPFRMWLIGRARANGGANSLAREIGVNDEMVRRWLQGYVWDNDPGWGGWASCEPRPIYTVGVATVDRVGVALGEPDLLDRLYPYNEESP